MVIIGAAMNHWYHMRHELPRRHQHADDVRLRRPIAAAAGRITSARRSCVRRPAGLPLAFALDWSRPPRQHEFTRFFYAHTDQWRYEKLGVDEILSPTAPAGPWDGAHDRLQRARRAHGLAAVGAAAADQSAAGRPRRGGRGRGAEGLCRQGAEDRRAAS